MDMCSTSLTYESGIKRYEEWKKKREKEEEIEREREKERKRIKRKRKYLFMNPPYEPPSTSPPPYTPTPIF